MVELIVNGETLELDYKTNIKYTKQISDIFDIAKVKASHTNSFSVPKTPNNTRIFQGLGLVGSTSTIPYEKIPVTLKYNGFDVIRNGWLDIKETSDVYKVNIIDGIIDFFKDIENYSLGDLDLSEIDHTKTLQSVVDSFSNENYKYIVGDYNGKSFTNNGFINVDYLVPSARYKYLLEKIFTSFGWTWSGSIFNNEDYLGSWVTYPKEAKGDIELEQIAYLYNGQKTLNPSSQVGGGVTFNNEWVYTDVQEGQIVNNQFIAPETNFYTIRVSAKGYVSQVSPPSNYFVVRVIKNGQILGNVIAWNIGSEIYQTTFEGYLTENDVIDFVFYRGVTFTYNPVLHLDYLEVVIRKSSNFQVDFSESLKEIKIKDFFFDFIRRFGLTMIPDNDNKHLAFHTLSERLNTANSIDWSEKYVRRTNESYLYGSYAQNNYYRHKYNGDNEDFNDGILLVNNKNLQNEKTLATTPFYSRTSNASNFLENTFIYPVWETEVKENEEELVLNYKSLNGRFYVIKYNTHSSPYIFESEISGATMPASNFPVLSSSYTHYSDLIPKYYDKYYQLLNNCKIHKIEVALSVFDIINLYFSKPVYFEQEASYYLINKVDFESGKVSTIEAVKINI